jgi:hypothetical protein
MLYTFEDLETGDARSAVALNEAAARFQPGGFWTDVERTTELEPCEIDGLPAIYREAEADAEAARRAMVEANPILKGKGRFTTPEALTLLTSAREKYHKCEARREACFCCRRIRIVARRRCAAGWRR